MGGGFGGLYTALSIASKAQPGLDIVLVDESDRFVFLPLLYDLVEGTATRQEVCPPYKELLQGTNIRFVQGTLQDVATTTTTNAKDSLGTATVADAVNPSNTFQVSFRQGVLAVGATPQSILNKVPGAVNYTQPFYTQDHALQTRTLLQQLQQQSSDKPLQLAVVGGGYGGVELAACLQRRFGSTAQVTLLAGSPPLQGTRAEPAIAQALAKLGVRVELCRVQSVEPVVETAAAVDAPPDDLHPRVRVRRTCTEKSEAADHSDNDQIWDAVFWTAGSGPAEPVSDANALVGLERIQGRLATDRTLRCYGKDRSVRSKPPLWALGDCATVIGGDPIPKTAQAAMQQSDVVAYNVLLEYGSTKPVGRRMTRDAPKTFAYQDLGSMMMLGGPNGVIAAPPDSSTLGPLFAPLIDTARIGLGVADSVLKQKPQKDSSPLANLSLGGYGLGVDDDPSKTPGSLAGTMAGAARRAVYAARMPTTRQRVYSAASAALSTALTLAKEAAQQGDDKRTDDKKTP